MELNEISNRQLKNELNQKIDHRDKIIHKSDKLIEINKIIEIDIFNLKAEYVENEDELAKLDDELEDLLQEILIFDDETNRRIEEDIHIYSYDDLEAAGQLFFMFDGFGP